MCANTISKHNLASLKVQFNDMSVTSTLWEHKHLLQHFNSFFIGSKTRRSTRCVQHKPDITCQSPHCILELIYFRFDQTHNFPGETDRPPFRGVTLLNAHLI
mmetsp:Transcript_29749/g.46700  ORF Transcript_29749/g.46700 Transcript_29749/m.46700 type:complete len:102 (-) Transcript_29749:378-683(-)